MESSIAAGMRVVITDGRYKGRKGTMIRKNGTNWIVGIDGLAPRYISPDNVQLDENQSVVAVEEVENTYTDQTVMFKTIAAQQFEVIWFVDGDNSARVVLAHLVRFCMQHCSLVLTYAQPHIRHQLQPHYNRSPLNSLSILMPCAGFEKNSADVFMARDLGWLHCLCETDTIFCLISRDRFDLSNISRGITTRPIHFFDETDKVGAWIADYESAEVTEETEGNH